MKMFLLTLLSFMLLACGTTDVDPGARPENGGTTPEETEMVLKDAPFPVGVAVTPHHMKSEPRYNALIKKEMNSITAENHMKMSHLSSARGEYTWDGADYIVSFAKENNMRVHGHALLWHRSIADWVNELPKGDRELWIEVMKEYITDVVTHFKGDVLSWDVVNEAFNDDGSWRSTPWYDNIGEDYMDLAFQFAHEADPDAILFYNDYGMEYSTAKRSKISEEVTAMIERGVPVHGIGLQMHIDIYSTKSNMVASINAAASCGVLVHVSEFDVRTNPDEDKNATFTEEVAQKQRESYQYMFEALMTIPQHQQFGVTMWGLVDNHSWLSDAPDWGLPFNKEYERKPAYYGIIDAITVSEE